ncbi:GAF and ANTAR domain-containing protein [Mycobacterium sp. 236(2023)]|uniref:GAF and ANTAR domain-containing protein n=1 Tax=Mycobacterium sp. 236(2023) TaxID=3038163 RepID=UPI0024150163|nr:GAF and ANTAR domain-containing protein [Mycobacterium sp. 236(2023)]MDG4667235.1 GAF and ANTAR domain-containing protein [Mycobacterium sp. 236(2023)]
MQQSIEITAEQSHGEAGVRTAIAQLIQTVRTEVSPSSTWEMTTTAAMKLSAVQYASIVRVGQGDCIRSIASTHIRPRVLDELQQRFREGPSLDAAWETQTRRVDDLADDERWPAFSDEAVAAAPIRSVLCVPLVTRHRGRAALNLYADQPYAFGREDELIGLMFARNAEVLLEVGRRTKRARHQTNRELIGQAKHILMKRYAVDPVTALSLLAQLSKDCRQPVSVVARALLGTESEH